MLVKHRAFIYTEFLFVIFKYTGAMNISVYAIEPTDFTFRMEKKIPEASIKLNITDSNLLEIGLEFLQSGYHEKEIIFESSSSCYPNWNVKFQKWDQNVSRAEIFVRRETNVLESSLSKFYSYLYFNIASFGYNHSGADITGNFTCSCKDNRSETMSVYVFVERESIPDTIMTFKGSVNLINRSKKFTKKLSNFNRRKCPWNNCTSFIELPCGVNKRNAPVHLYVQPVNIPENNLIDMLNSSTYSTYILINANISIMKSETSGYKLDILGLKWVTSFKWFCSELEIENFIYESDRRSRMVEINFHHEDPTIEPLLVPKNDPVEIIHRNGKVCCCHPICNNCRFIGSPKLRIESYKNAFIAGLMDPLIIDEYIKETTIFDSTMQTDPIYDTKPCTSFDIGSMQAQGFNFTCKSNYYYNNSSKISTFTSTEQYYWNVLNKTGNSNYVLYPKYLENSIRLTIKRFEEFSSKTYLEIPIITRGVTWGFGNSSSLRTINVTKTVIAIRDLPKRFNGTDYISEGSKICATCEANSYNFAYGIIWSLQYQNGSVEYLNQSLYTEIDQGWTLFRIIQSKICIAVRRGMNKIQCHGPLLNSYEWRNSSAALPSILVRFEPVVELENNQRSSQVFMFYEGEDVEIPCSITSEDLAVVKIYYRPNPNQNTSWNTIYHAHEIGLYDGPFNTRYTMKNVSKEISGNYLCLTASFSGFNYDGKYKKSLEFNITVMEKIIPVILKTPNLAIVKWDNNETNKTLNCSATGDPLPEMEKVKWFHGNSLLSENINTRNESDTAILTSLRIPIVTDEAKGIYICSFSNRLGDNSTKSFVVEVEHSYLIWYLVGSIGSVIMIILMTQTYLFIREKRKGQKQLIQLEKYFRNPRKITAESVRARRQKWISLPYISQKYDINKRSIKLQSKLGNGNFGVVFAGNWFRNATRKSVAVKMLQENQATLENLEILCNELKMMMYINYKFGVHKNIVNLIGAITSDFQKKKLSLVMELCVNGSLDDYLKHHKNELIVQVNETWAKFSPQMYKWSYEIACGMRFLGKCKIIHIDLATRNVLLTWDNVAKIGDFGLSRLLDEGMKYYKNRGTVMFPSDTTAPEAVMQCGKFSPESDVWSYGGTLVEIFSFGNLMESLEPVDKFIQEQFGHEVKVKPDILNEITQMMKQCWAINPKQRPRFKVLQKIFMEFYRREFSLSTMSSEMDDNTESSEHSNGNDSDSGEENEIAKARYLSWESAMQI